MEIFSKFRYSFTLIANKSVVWEVKDFPVQTIIFFAHLNASDIIFICQRIHIKLLLIKNSKVCLIT